MTGTFPQAEYDLCIQRVQRPVFLTKLAQDWGIVPQSAQEETKLLELASLLREAQETEEVKTAAAGGSGNDFLDTATEQLKVAMSQLGYGEHQSSRENMIQEAAATWAKDEKLCNAVLTLAQAVS